MVRTLRDAYKESSKDEDWLGPITTFLLGGGSTYKAYSVNVMENANPRVQQICSSTGYKIKKEEFGMNHYNRFSVALGLSRQVFDYNENIRFLKEAKQPNRNTNINNNNEVDRFENLGNHVYDRDAH